MIKISAEMNKTDLARWRRALKNLQWRVNWWIKANGGELNRRGAEGYTNRVIENIHSQAFASQYPSYNSRYEAWKDKNFPTGRFWELKGDLLKNLAHFRYDTGWMGGIKEGIFDTGGKSWFGKGDVGEAKKIAAYARIGEWGGSFGEQTHLGRPVFTPTLEEYEKSEWLNEVNAAMKDIEKAWS